MDVQLATYEVAQDAPLSKTSQLTCKCAPRATITPNPHSDDPPPDKGKTKFYIDPEPGEQIQFTNPLGQPLIVATATGETTVDPGERTDIDPDETGPIIVQTVTGVTVLTAHIDRSPFAPVPLETILPGDPFEGTEWEFDDGFSGNSPDFNAPSNLPPAESTSGFTRFSPDGIPSRTMTLIGSRPQNLVVEGNFPKGTTFSIDTPGTSNAGSTFFEVGDGTTVRAGYVKFGDIKGDVTNAKLTARDPDGLRIAQEEIGIRSAAINTTLDPVSGPAGSKATLLVDCSEVVALLVLQTGGEASDFEVHLDYSNAGGSTGPAVAPLGDDAMARVPVTRGSVPGGFQVGVSLAYRTPDPALFAEEDCCEDN
jgi:hypothetical protein